MPTIHVYTMAHDEAFMLPYWMRHYRRFAERIVVADNESTDGTAEIARSLGAEVYPISSGGRFEEDVLLRFKNEAWKGSRGRAEWVVVVDADEFIWHPDLLGLLAKYRERGVTLPLVEGWQMVSQVPPSGNGQIYDELKHGFRDCHHYSKYAVFNPAIEIRYDYGCHEAHPAGPVLRSPTTEIKLLHYAHLGREYFVRKYSRVIARVSPKDRTRWKYWSSREDIEKYWDGLDVANPERAVP